MKAVLPVIGLLLFSVANVRASGVVKLTGATQGGVSVKHSDGSAEVVTGNASLVAGDTVVTGDNADATLRFADGTYITLKNNTSVLLKGPGEQRIYKLELTFGSLTATSSVGPSDTYEIVGLMSTTFFHRQSGYVGTSSGGGGRDLIICSICSKTAKACRSNDFYVLDGAGNCRALAAHSVAQVDAAHGIILNAGITSDFAFTYVKTLSAPYAGDAFAASGAWTHLSGSATNAPHLQGSSAFGRLDVTNIPLSPNSRITIDPKILGSPGVLQAISTNPTVKVQQNADGTLTLIAGPNAHGTIPLTNSNGDFGIVTVRPLDDKIRQ